MAGDATPTRWAEGERRGWLCPSCGRKLWSTPMAAGWVCRPCRYFVHDRDLDRSTEGRDVGEEATDR